MGQAGALLTESAAGEDSGLKQEVGGRNGEGHGPCGL